MSRLSSCFRAARAAGRGAMIPYVTAGFPTMAATLEIAAALADSGADILELGVPFSDPVADGPVIQRASEVALAAGATLERCLELADAIRRRAPQLGIVLFSYYNPLLQFGLGRLGTRLGEAGVDAILVTDLVPEESDPLVEALRPRGIDTVFLIAPTSSDDRLAKVAAATTGFVYAVSRTGVTGARETMAESARTLVDRMRAYTDLPIAVGFGISTAEHVADVWRFAEGAVIGSRLVAEIAGAGADADVANVAARCIASLMPATMAEY